jgi:hypothetical protein
MERHVILVGYGVVAPTSLAISCCISAYPETRNPKPEALTPKP